MAKNNIGTTGNKNNIWLVVGVVLVVGLVASLITAGITANAVRVQTSIKYNAPQVYSKTEVDGMICRTDGEFIPSVSTINNIVVGSEKLDTCNEICASKKGSIDNCAG